MCEVFDVAPLLRALVDHLVGLESLPSGSRRPQVGERAQSIRLTRRDESRCACGSPQDPRAIRVAALVMSDPSDTLTLAALAATFAISARTLARHFLSDTGVTLGQWRRQFRLTHAITLVAAGRPVKDVALEVGYESPSAFVAAFKRALGTTPARLFRR